MKVHEVSGRMVFPGCRRGFSLLEILSVLWALGLVLFIGVTTLIGAMRIEKTATAACHRHTLRNILADQFRSDVALAADTPDHVGQVKAGPTCLVLGLTDGKYVVYRTEAGRLERAELANAAAAPYWVSLGGENLAVEFARTGADRRVVSLTVSESAGAGTRKRLHEISATLGGDLR